jgi:LacI family transcriptional regulator
MKRPTQLDVARMAGVSRATVSLVANGQADGRVPISRETRERVLKAIDELGYEPDARAQAFRSGDTKIIGLIVPDIRNPHFWDHLLGVEQEAYGAGYNIMFTSLGLKEQYDNILLKDLLRQRVDGMILMGIYLDHGESGKKTLEHLNKRLSVVEITDKLNPENPIDTVFADYRDATCEVMAHLHSLGHRKIGFLYGVSTELLGNDRLEPFYESMQATGLPVSPDCVIHTGPTIEEGYQAALKMLQLPDRPTAILAINDLLALAVMRAAADLGLQIPRDLSLFGFDNIFADNYLVPRLSTVTKDAIGMGRTAVQMLIQRIEEPNRPRQVIEKKTRLILRESTGPAPVLP